MIARLAYATFVIGFGSPVLGMVIMGAAVAASVGLMIRRARAAHDTVMRTRLLVLLGSALVMPVWSVLFLNHTLLHAIWMVRPFAWFIALAGLLRGGQPKIGRQEAPPRSASGNTVAGAPVATMHQTSQQNQYHS